MHQSRLSNIVIDCQLEDLAPAIEFWSRALGKPVADADEDGDGKYAKLQTAADEPVILLQKVDHPNRVHLDIETDDIDAEVQRLEALGAHRIEFVHGRWWVMQAPSGHRFCVVQRPEGRAIQPHANRWD
ncbi:VOC family protein [Rhodanobacter sp. L36]|uniref:VOC family protein n=1 Tax=Rhodanobacter sp. L36 TaxID=1747221 RepID=UPI00131E5C11|nr:VOC family protein [Rhodanobacter sp. L36]